MKSFGKFFENFRGKNVEMRISLFENVPEEFPSENVQVERKCSSRAKREIRKVRQENQGKNVELQPRQVLRLFYRISGAKMLKCSWNVLGMYETIFETKMSSRGQDEFRNVRN